MFDIPSILFFALANVVTVAPLAGAALGTKETLCPLGLFDYRILFIYM